MGAESRIKDIEVEKLLSGKRVRRKVDIYSVVVSIGVWVFRDKYSKSCFWEIRIGLLGYYIKYKGLIWSFYWFW